MIKIFKVFLKLFGGIILFYLICELKIKPNEAVKKSQILVLSNKKQFKP